MITHNIILLCLASIFGIFMVWSVGANGLANIMSPTLGSKTITVKQAVIVAIIFETAGAVLGGGNVAKTIQNGLVNTHVLNYPPEFFIYGMLAVVLAGATWMVFSSKFGMPVSITSAIVGATVGFGVLALGVHAVYWKQVEYIGIVWLVSPFAAALAAYLLFLSIQRLILTSKQPARQARKYVPLYLMAISVVLAEITVLNGLRHLGILFSAWDHFLLLIVIGAVFSFLIWLGYRRIPIANNADHHSQFSYVEQLFAILMLLATCAMVYAHGSNDIAISVGPIAAIISLIKTGGALHNGLLVHTVLGVGSLIVVIGLLTYGRGVITTVGSGVTTLTPSRAYCATISAAVTVIISTSTGIPISATQTLVGSILGVGLARGIGALDLRTVRNILVSWVVTIPVAAGLAVLFFEIIKYIFYIT